MHNTDSAWSEMNKYFLYLTASASTHHIDARSLAISKVDIEGGCGVVGKLYVAHVYSDSLGVLKNNNAQ